ncbi:MAG: O-antigen ligase family protein [Peptococcaceae bacterium]|nr:O-antigen ligase family protein [Peptococcaceae bacterium]
MTPADMVKNSVAFQIWAGICGAVLKYGADSRILGRLGSPPRYASARCAEGSLVLGTASRAVSCLFRPLMAAGDFLRRQAAGSRVLNLKVPAALAESRILKAAAGIRVESALWLVILYPVIDFLLRSVPSLRFLSSGWDELVLLAVILSWPVQMALRGRLTYRYTALDLPILVYIGITLFLFFMRSKNVSLAVEGSRIYLQYLVWFFVGSNLLLNRRQFNALVRGIIAVAVLVSAVGIFQYVTGVETPAQWVDQAEAGIRTRAFSIVVSPNVLGSLLIIFAMITGGQLLASRSRPERWACLAALAAIAACMVFTYSRGAWLAMGLAAAAFSLMYNPRLLILMAAMFLAAAKLVPGIGARLSYMLSPAYLASSQRAGRLALWQAALDRFRQDPLFGTGFGSFGGAVAARRVPGSFYVDNFYLKTLAESGIIGLAALVWILGSALRCGYAAYKKISRGGLKIMAAAILSALLGVAAHNGVENIFEVPMMATYFWLLAGILAALPDIDE